MCKSGHQDRRLRASFAPDKELLGVCGAVSAKRIDSYVRPCLLLTGFKAYVQCCSRLQRNSSKERKLPKADDRSRRRSRRA